MVEITSAFEQPSAIRALRIVVVKNGMVVYPHDDSYRVGQESPSYVFMTVEQLVDWLRRQVWAFPDAFSGGNIYFGDLMDNALLSKTDASGASNG